MNRLISFVAAVTMLFVMVACDDTTDTLGNSLTNKVDVFSIITDTFGVKTSTVEANSVLSKGANSYLGYVKDSETDTNVSSSYATQFAVTNSLKGESIFSDKDSIRSLNDDGQIVADSCLIYIYFNSMNGDSLNPMKLTAREMAKTLEEGVNYYTDFDPESSNMLREGTNAIRKNKMFTPIDLNFKDSLRNAMETGSTYKAVKIPLNDPYVDVDGNTYDNYGTYVMRKYFESKDDFSDSYKFSHNVCPGFFLKITDGIGVMAEVNYTDLVIYYKFVQNDTLYSRYTMFPGNEEVLQVTHVENDKTGLDALIADNSCTYLKTPAGLFTSVELPVADIMKGHEGDSISSASLTFTGYNSKDEETAYGASSYVLLLPEDSVKTFFENKEVPDSKYSYLAGYSSKNQYSFSNISQLVSEMYKAKQAGTAGENWNKAVLIPVTVTTTSSSSSTTSTSSVVHNMGLTSIRLKRGDGTAQGNVKLNVIYNRFTN